MKNATQIKYNILDSELEIFELYLSLVIFFQICMLTICLSLIFFFSIFVTLVISRQGYYFNNSGLLACDILYVRPSFRILSACMFYFPATMLFMYCYGSLYHFSYKKCSLNSIRNFNLKSARSPQVSATQLHGACTYRDDIRVIIQKYIIGWKIKFLKT